MGTFKSKFIHDRTYMPPGQEKRAAICKQRLYQLVQSSGEAESPILQHVLLC